MDTAIKFST